MKKNNISFLKNLSPLKSLLHKRIKQIDVENERIKFANDMIKSLEFEIQTYRDMISNS